MKSIFLLVFTFIFITGNAQNLSLELQDPLNLQIGAHYKDNANTFNNYVGTWQYTNGDTSFKIVLKVQPDVFVSWKGGYYEDLLVGEYRYIENGVEKVNTLQDIGLNLGNAHHIKGNLILRDCYFMPQDDCIEGEVRLDLGLIDPITPHYATMVLKRRVISGQQAIKAFIYFTYAGPYMGEGVPNPSPSMPWQQEYVLFKQL